MVGLELWLRVDSLHGTGQEPLKTEKEGYENIQQASVGHCARSQRQHEQLIPYGAQGQGE